MTKLADQADSESKDGVEIGVEALSDSGRRDALKKIAKYSAYSALALLALMKSAKAVPPSIVT